MNTGISRIGLKWLAEEDKKLAQELSQNKSYEEIALEHGRTVTGIKSRVIDKFIYPKYNENDIDNLVMQYNIDADMIKKYIDNKKTPKTVSKNPELSLEHKIMMLDQKLMMLDQKVMMLDKKIMMMS
jgi:hypothetical protein